MSETFQGKIRSLTFKGLGVVDHADGMVFFVQGAWPGDEGIFEVTSREKRFGFATLKELTTASPNRRKSDCPHFGFEEGQCGGCSWIFANYNSQVEEKQKLVAHLLERSKILGPHTKLSPIMAAPEEFNYRNRAQFKTDGEVIGYVTSGTNTLAPIDDCIVLNSKCRGILKTLKQQLPNPACVPPAGGDWNFIEIDNEILPNTKIPINQRRPFKQGNSEQNGKMLFWLNEQIKDMDKKSGVIELFCGSGNFTQVFSQNDFKNIFAAELNPKAIDKLKERNLKNVTAATVNLTTPHLWPQLSIKKSKPKILFLDPPREGFSDIDKFLKVFSNIEDIFYVSCDLSTFIEDTKKLIKLGYEVLEIQPLDQFPQTPHIEIMSRLKLSNK